MKGKKSTKGPRGMSTKMKYSSKTYEEPSNLMLIKPSTYSFLDIEFEKSDANCGVASKYVEGNQLITVLGKEGGILVSRNNSTKFFCPSTPEYCKDLIKMIRISDSGSTVAGLSDLHNIVFVWEIGSHPPKLNFAVHTSSCSLGKGGRRKSSSSSAAAVKRARSIKRGAVMMELSNDGKLLFVHEHGNPMFVWGLVHLTNALGGIETTAQIICTLQAPSYFRGQAQVTSVAFGNRDHERWIMVGLIGESSSENKGGDCCIYDIPPITTSPETQQQIFPFANFRGQEAKVSSALLNMDSTLVFVGTMDSKGYLWRVDNQKCSMFLSHPTRTVSQHSVFIPGGAYCVTSCSDGFLRIWGCFPHFSRDIRGFSSLIARALPPGIVCRRGAYVLHLAYEQSTFSLIVVWRSHETSTLVPEPVIDDLEESYSFSPGIVCNYNKNNHKTTMLDTISVAVLGTNTNVVVGPPPVDDTKRTRFIFVTRYSNIPIFVKRWRSDVCLMLTNISRDRMGVLTEEQSKKFLKLVMKYL